jgi:hypothetical protein
MVDMHALCTDLHAEHVALDTLLVGLDEAAWFQSETAMLIAQYMPTYDVRDYHEAQVMAPADTAYAVLRALDLQRSWTVQALFALRSLPSRLLRLPSPPPPSGTFLAQALAIGWVILEEAPGRELVAGAVTQPWRAVVTFHACRR